MYVFINYCIIHLRLYEIFYSYVLYRVPCNCIFCFDTNKGISYTYSLSPLCLCLRECTDLISLLAFVPFCISQGAFFFISFFAGCSGFQWLTQPREFSARLASVKPGIPSDTSLRRLFSLSTFLPGQCRLLVVVFGFKWLVTLTRPSKITFLVP